MVTALEDVRDALDPGTVVAHGHGEQLRRRAAFHGEAHAAAAGIGVRVPNDLRHRGGDTSLVLLLEAEVLRDLARALPRAHDVVLARDGQGEDRRAPAALATTTVTSSRLREKSR